MVKSGTPLGKEILEKMKQGELVDMVTYMLHCCTFTYAHSEINPNGEFNLQEFVIRLFLQNMVENISHKGYLIDGFPREASQGHMFEEVVRQYFSINTNYTGTII